MLKDKIKQNKRKKNRLIIGLIVLVLVLFFPLLDVFTLTRVYTDALAGKSKIDTAQKNLVDKNFSAAAENFSQAAFDFKNAERKFKKITVLDKTLYTGVQLDAVEKLLRSGQYGVEAANSAVVLAGDFFSSINFRDNLNYSQITEEQKKLVLQKIVASYYPLKEIHRNIEKSLDILEQLPSKGLYGKIENFAGPIREKLPLMRDLSANLLIIPDMVSSFSGYPQEKKFLFLLQNNHELRPTGGFIGTYGIIKIINGDVDDFYTDNIYNLDKPAQDFLQVPAPAPLVKYLSINDWWMRDSNWSPDFSQSAQKALWFYQAEHGLETPLDGVVAITPELIKSFLVLVGNITVDKVEFSPQNLTERLEKRVGKDFAVMGIEEEDRKEIIGKLGKELLNRLFNLPASKWIDAYSVVINALDQKHVLAFSYDNKAAEILREKNWDGKIVTNGFGDYLAVFDANLAALKTDAVVDRSIDYYLKLNQSGRLQAKVIIRYVNNGTFTWKTTRLRNYTRVYVPFGSELIGYQGLMDMDRSKVPGKAEVYDEFGKTVFAGFIAVEPGESGDLTFDYLLPDNVKTELFAGGMYKLYVQKQPGTLGHKFSAQIDLGRSIRGFEIDPQARATKQGDDLAVIKSNLTVDREFKIKY